MIREHWMRALLVFLGIALIGAGLAGAAVFAAAPRAEPAQSAAPVVGQEGGAQDPTPNPSSGQVGAALREVFAAEGIHFDAAAGVASVPAEILVRGDLLEYLVVNPRGATHESAFMTSISASRINAALLALGVEPGRNARWSRKDPPPTLEQMRDGAPAFDVAVPEGDGFYLYVAWKLDGETYFHRMEDLILDLRNGTTMRRHRWVYLGSRMLKMRGDDGQEAFAADLEGNLICIAFFEQGNTLLTGALPECVDQTIWQANFWLLPARESRVELVFAREQLDRCPKEIEARLHEALRVEPRESR